MTRRNKRIAIVICGFIFSLIVSYFFPMFTPPNSNGGQLPVPVQCLLGFIMGLAIYVVIGLIFDMIKGYINK